MQYLWAVTFVARQGSLRWPPGPCTSRSPGNIRHHYSSSCKNIQPRDIPIPVIGQNLKHSSYANLSEWFMVIYVVGCPCSCLFQLVQYNFFFLLVGWLQLRRPVHFFSRPQFKFPCNTSYISTKSTTPWGKNWTEPYWHVPEEMAKSQWPLLISNENATSLMPSSMPQWAHVQ